MLGGSRCDMAVDMLLIAIHTGLGTRQFFISCEADTESMRRRPEDKIQMLAPQALLVGKGGLLFETFWCT